MSTFFEVLQGRIREKQLFSEMFITFFCPTYAQPAKDIGFYIVSLVGQVLYNAELNRLVKEWAQTQDNVYLLDFNRYLKGRESFTNNINHFTRQVYYEISREIVAVLEQRGGKLRGKSQAATDMILQIKEVARSLWKRVKK